jgi:hypothetical protein
MSTQDPIVNRIRIIPRPDDFLDRNVGNSGELYYSKDANTLRVYGGRKRGGYEVVSEDNIRRNAARQDVATIKYRVTVTGPQGDDTGNKYNLNGEYTPRIDFIAGFSYYFDQSDSTNAYYPNAEGEAFNIHPLYFSETAEGTAYETDVMYLIDNHPVDRDTYVAKFNTTTERAVQITITTSTPETLYYNCTTHAGMGNEGSVSLPGGNNAAITVHDQAPEDPENGNLWFNTNNGVLYVYTTDADSSQWVQPSVPTNVDIQGGFNQVAVEGTNLVLYTGQVLNFEAGDNVVLTPEVTTKTITIGTTGLATTAYVDSEIAANTGVDLTAFSVGAENLPSGNGSISYDNTTGVFTYTPPDTSSFISLGGLSVTTGTASGSGSLTYNNVNGVFTFRPADLTGLGGGSSFDQDLNTTDDVTFNSVTTSTSFTAGGAGSPTLDSASTITLDAPDGTRVTGGAFRVPTLTTTERNALTPGNGDIIYNTTDNKFQGYENGAWVNLI